MIESVSYSASNTPTRHGIYVSNILKTGKRFRTSSNSPRECRYVYSLPEEQVTYLGIVDSVK